MARGWESKAVESQIESAQNNALAERVKPERSPAELEIIDRRNSLLLLRKKIEQDLINSKNSRYRKLLENSLADLDRELKDLD